MTFLELQEAVLERFTAGTARANAKLWLNLVGAFVYELEQWTFRHATDDVTTAVGSIDVTGEATDVGEVLNLWNASGDKLHPLGVLDFYEEYQPMIARGETGLPEAFTVLAGQVQVGPPSSEAATYRLLYLRRWTDLDADTDVPALPTSLHWVLVAGAMAVGQAHSQDPSAVLLDPVVARTIEGMRAEYLMDVRTADVWGETWSWQ